ncbi:hypothetical protein [Pseudomonas putida]|uniref:hypothetical protein n=1 Tax=Pseudomonas putida TaxID=303 RepID=UPI002DBE6D80|nr:hypothetical protein [Pseudomonas putida]WRW03101.1 hypothetical protein VPZ82_26095 [Pseudomonas putida]
MSTAKDTPSTWHLLSILGLFSLVVIIALCCLSLPVSNEVTNRPSAPWMPMASVVGTALLSPLHALWISRYGALKTLRLAVAALIPLGIAGPHAPCLAGAFADRLFIGVAAALAIAAALHLARQLGALRRQATLITMLGKNSY